jgi:hypothetical protein
MGSSRATQWVQLNDSELCADCNGVLTLLSRRVSVVAEEKGERSWIEGLWEVAAKRAGPPKLSESRSGKRDFQRPSSRV